MLIPTIIMGVLAVVLFAIAYSKGNGQHIDGIKASISLMLQILPLLFFAFIVAGLVQNLLPHEIIAKWIGTDSGWLAQVFFGRG